MTSKFMSLNYKDLLKGALIAFLTALINSFYELINNHPFPTTWLEVKPSLIIGFSAFLAYIIKNALTNNEGKLLKKDA